MTQADAVSTAVSAVTSLAPPPPPPAFFLPDAVHDDDTPTNTTIDDEGTGPELPYMCRVQERAQEKRKQLDRPEPTVSAC